MQDLVEHLTALLKKKDFKLVTAESCTGGLLAATLTHRSGASEIYERGFITYSDESKTDILGVPEELLREHGAVSAQTAESMAIGALENSRADLAVSITGIAGPSGATSEKPVGLVYFGYALRGGSSGSIEHHFEGERHEIQSHASMTALRHLIKVMEPFAQ